MVKLLASSTSSINMLVDVAFLLMEISWGFVMGLLWLDLSGDFFLACGGGGGR